MSDRPVALAKIRALLDPDMPLRVIHESLARLQEEYEQKHHGLRLVEVAEGFQFRTKATYSKYVQDLFKVNSLVLSPTALEVLAVIAYKQPVAKTEVDKIRGVDSSHIVRALMDKRLVRVVGRSDEVGRPVLYGTTPEFLEVFNLANIAELPPEHELQAMTEQSVGKIADITNLVHAGDKQRFSFDEIDELDQLSEAIKQIPSDTSFTKSLVEEEKRRVSQSNEPIRSAFDLLEEFLGQQIIVSQNKASTTSEMFSALLDPKVVDDLEAGPFNLPEAEDEEDFRMIDLETGLPIEEDKTVSEDEESEELLGADLLARALDDEAESLSEALDEAFARLTGERLEDDTELEYDASEMDEKTRDLDELTQQIGERARELDMDLDFLSEDPDA
jgi:segregation and condensation protein B